MYVYQLSQMLSQYFLFYFSDIKFLIGQNRKAVYAHRCILASRCAVFKAMFADVSQRNGTAEKDVPLILSDMSPDIFLAMLEFIYTNCVALTPKIVSSTRSLFDHLELLW